MGRGTNQFQAIIEPHTSWHSGISWSSAKKKKLLHQIISYSNVRHLSFKEKDTANWKMQNADKPESNH